MHKFICLFVCIVSLNVVRTQFSLSDLTSAGYPRMKFPGTLGSLISGQGLGMNSGFGQVLSSLINGGSSSGSSSSSSSGGSPLAQLATAASTQYINAIRSSPLFSQFTGGSQREQNPPMAPPHHHHYQHQYGPPQQFNPISLLGGENPLYGAQQSFDGVPPLNMGGNGNNAFPQYAAGENFFGNQFGPSSSHQIPSSQMYPQGSSYGSQLPAPIHNLDKK